MAKSKKPNMKGKVNNPRTKAKANGIAIRKEIKASIVPYVSNHLQKVDYRYHDIDDTFRPWISCKYEPQMCQYVIDNANKGMFLVDFAVAFGVGEQTVFQWRNKFPEFAEALLTAKASSELWLLDHAKKMAKGEAEGDISAIKWLMAIGHGKSEKQETKMEITGNMNLTVSAAQIIAQRDQERKLNPKDEVQSND